MASRVFSEPNGRYMRTDVVGAPRRLHDYEDEEDHWRRRRDRDHRQHRRLQRHPRQPEQDHRPDRQGREEGPRPGGDRFGRGPPEAIRQRGRQRLRPAHRDHGEGGRQGQVGPGARAGRVRALPGRPAPVRSRRRRRPCRVAARRGRRRRGQARLRPQQEDARRQARLRIGLRPGGGGVQDEGGQRRVRAPSDRAAAGRPRLDARRPRQDDRRSRRWTASSRTCPRSPARWSSAR